MWIVDIEVSVIQIKVDLAILSIKCYAYYIFRLQVSFNQLSFNSINHYICTYYLACFDTLCVVCSSLRFGGFLCWSQANWRNSFGRISVVAPNVNSFIIYMISFLEIEHRKLFRNTDILVCAKLGLLKMKLYPYVPFLAFSTCSSFGFRECLNRMPLIFLIICN